MKKILVLFLAVVLVSILSCTNSFLKKMLVDEDMGGEKTGFVPPEYPDVGFFEPVDDFVKIIPPVKGIAGVEPDSGTLPGPDAKWKGVFIKDRKVTLSPYKLGKTEVMYKTWKEVYDWAVKPENGYTFQNAGKKGSSGTGTEDEPVTTISWRDCIVWCNAYTAKTMGEGECVYRKSKTDTTILKDSRNSAGTDCDAVYADMSKKGFRLPTEAEWEYAARWQGSNNTNAVQYGDVWLTKLNSASGAEADYSNVAETKKVAWYKDNAGGKTHSVGEKGANVLDLNDMSGNVLEWCFDWYADIAVGEVSDFQGPASGERRVVRGGLWRDAARICTVGLRNHSLPSSKGDALGFRLACRP